MRVDLQTLQRLQLALAEYRAQLTIESLRELQNELGLQADEIIADLVDAHRAAGLLAWDGRERRMRAPVVDAGTLDYWRDRTGSGRHLASAETAAAPQQAPPVTPAPERAVGERVEP